jgi:septal ring factor EnvC (AmiA/AmiB activator)
MNKLIFLKIRNILARSLFVVFMSFSIMNAYADNQTANVQQQIKALANKINSLEKRVKQLEAALTVDQANPKAGVSARRASGLLQPTNQIKENWTALKRDLSENEVLALLGKPSQRVKLGMQVMWYYQYLGVGSGSVIFTHNKKLISWQKPAF